MSLIPPSQSSELKKKLWVIVPAAGVGRRFGGSLPKQYLPLGDKLVLEHTLDKLLSVPQIEHVWLPVSEADEVWPSLAPGYSDRVTVVRGGAERADSVMNAMEAVSGEAQDDDWVLVHDVARPCIRCQDVEALIKAVENSEVGGLLAVPVTDTLKKSDSAGCVENTVPRDSLWRAYTPQMFRFGVLWRGMEEAMGSGRLVTDEASAVEYLGYKPILVEGHSDNIKITHPQDLSLALMFLQRIQQEES
ncbi:2-C-methyl-D-erythritol 4-phosphate cytidylyltransferase [Hahella sp. CCB-MM4]|uniref:2-C-methyl-D-erythritol 4-phosphate cytidylyltransferase n=1 Tax=Hahella sp. (strain CCB-MM4) TaxID=1926491 RepID=UPI000B9ABC80|nr:2-C-methyl-D-erythritol 4-phosphate cytidylyltransferase [Hahella sp. CCB-MM4]OZG72467.1 2-C-methyl-D-erythritol 4-phosphate cytidylyltransferase [Hahella sp. CCB-MM4]